MKLSQVFDQLTSGELNMLSMGGAKEGEITEANYRPIANHVFLGLTALYKRFSLKDNQVKVQLLTGVTAYKLNSKYAVNNDDSDEATRYLLDTPDDKFVDDIIKIKSVVATDTDYELPLNSYGDIYTVATPTLHSIRVPADIVDPDMNLPADLRTTTLTVKYQANHPSFVTQYGVIVPTDIDIELPDSHMTALLYFVASRVHNPIGMQNEFNAGNNWAAKYEQECVRLELDGDEVDQGAQVNRARRGGWI